MNIIGCDQLYKLGEYFANNYLAIERPQKSKSFQMLTLKPDEIDHDAETTNAKLKWRSSAVSRVLLSGVHFVKGFNAAAAARGYSFAQFNEANEIFEAGADAADKIFRNWASVKSIN